MSNNYENEALEPIANLDHLIYEPACMMIAAFLSTVDRADFTLTMHQTGLSRGNLSTHMSKLEKAGYIEISKEFVEKRPLTLLHLTHKGTQAFKQYRQNMKEGLGDQTTFKTKKARRGFRPAFD